MGCITKTLLRTAVIGGLALGGLTLVLGPDRVAAGFSQIRSYAICWFDENVDNPILIRQQLKRLQEQYPEKIRDVRRSLAEVEAETVALTRDREVSTKVVTMASADLQALGGLVEKANIYVAASAGDSRPVVVKFQGRNLTIDQAYATATRIKQTAVNFQDRLTADERDLTLLETQRKRLAEQLGKLQSEYSAFQAQAWQIERQIAAMERNEKLIDMLEDREGEITSNDKWQVKTLDQLAARLASIQAEHEAVLETLGNGLMGNDYEHRAVGQAVLNDASNPLDLDNLFVPPIREREFPQTPVIIDENTETPAAPSTDNGQVALLPGQNGGGQ